ncbi:MAG: hypothetical protein U0M42_07755 [Acutalibacteraceae bacterium]|nr:hypothetical protein [Acutalibacteraceae bacterium]
MKKNLFNILLTLFGILLLISIFFYFCFDVAKQEFTNSIIGMTSSIFFLFEAKNAYKPLIVFGVANPVKGMFHNMGKPQGYKVLCIISLIFFAVAGTIDFIEGIQTV